MNCCRSLTDTVITASSGIIAGLVTISLLSMLVTVPWMLGTHCPTRYSRFMKNVSFPFIPENPKHDQKSRVITLSNEVIRIPPYDRVKTFGLQFFLEVHPSWKNYDIRLVHHLHLCHPETILKCFDKHNTELVRYFLKGVSKKEHYFELQRIVVPEPVSHSLEVDTGSPKCVLSLDTSNNVNCTCAEWPHLQDVDIFWALNIYPNWHWTDWGPRLIMEPLFHLLSLIWKSVSGNPLKGW